METKRTGRKLRIIMIVSLIIGVTGILLHPRIPYLSPIDDRIAFYQEFDPEGGQTYDEFVAIREAFIVAQSFDWLVEASSALRAVGILIVLTVTSTIAFVVFLICMARLVIGALPGGRRKIVPESISRLVP